MENSNTSLPGNTGNSDDGKMVAILSYLTIVGWIVAYVMNSSNKTALGAYHLRQTILLHIIAIIVGFLRFAFLFMPYIGFLVAFVLFFCWLGLFILWLIGFIAAINGTEKPMPVIGGKAQTMFAGIK